MTATDVGAATSRDLNREEVVSVLPPSFKTVTIVFGEKVRAT
jgi:hypothetical protein